MSRQTGIITILGVLGVVVCLLLFGRRESSVVLPPVNTNATHDLPSPKISSTTNSASAPVIPATRNAPENLIPPSASAPPAAVASSKPVAALIPSAPEFTNLPPQTVMENLHTAFRSYQSMFRENPVGTNPEITQALDGGNRKQAHFLSEADGLRVNARGELIDPWGTPFFFHQLSGTEMEIHSAGPDRVMWTQDDLVIK